MKKTSSNLPPKSLDALLAEMPLEPRDDFADRVIECMADNSTKIERALRAMPIVPDPAFEEKAVAAMTQKSNSLAFPVRNFVHRFSTIAAGLAVFAGAWFLAAPQYRAHANARLAEHITQTVQSDPELYALAQDDDDELSFDELLVASQILAAIDPANLEILAYND